MTISTPMRRSIQGLASLYKVASPVTTIAVVRAIEEMGATSTKSVKVTVTALMEKLGISGRGTASERLRDAEERGYIKLVEKQGGYGRTTPREYTIEKYAVEIEQETQIFIRLWGFSFSRGGRGRAKKFFGRTPVF